MRHRIFIGPNDVAGYFGGLADGFRAIGVPCMFVDETPDVFQYRRSNIHGLLGRAQAFAAARSSGRSWPGWIAVHLVLRALRLPLRLAILTIALLRCDVFIFTSGNGFFRGHELPVLRRLGKRIIWVFTGSDHRPPYLSGRYVRRARLEGWKILATETRRTASRVALAERYSDVIVAHSASAQFHVRPFVQILAVGLPVSGPPAIDDSVDEHAPPETGRVRVVHSPSDPESKGTDIIRTIVASMVADSLPVDYEEITGRPHDEVIRALAGADLLIDEVYGDTPMGVLATEAAFLGVPTVCGGYYAAHLMADAPDGVVPPSRFVDPADLEAAVRELVRDRVVRRNLGRAARAFVTRRWQQGAVAERYIQLLEGQIPAPWTFDPMRQGYSGGWGIGAADRRSAVSSLVAGFGVEALALPPNSRVLEGLLAEVMPT